MSQLKENDRISKETQLSQGLWGIKIFHRVRRQKSRKFIIVLKEGESLDSVNGLNIGKWRNENIIGDFISSHIEDVNDIWFDTERMSKDDIQSELINPMTGVRVSRIPTESQYGNLQTIYLQGV